MVMCFFPHEIFADTTTIFSERVYTLDTSSNADSVRIYIEYVSEPLDSGLFASFQIYNTSEAVWVSTMKFIPHRDSGFTIVPYVYLTPQPVKGDMNNDGVVNWIDLWTIFIMVIR